MSKKHNLVRLFFAKMKPEFFELSPLEQAEFMKKDRENLDHLGMKAISMIECSGSDKDWDYIGVEGWPSRESVLKREKFEKEELQISKYVVYKTFFGVEQSFEKYGK